VTLAVPDRKIRDIKLGALKRGCEAESFPSFLKSGMLMCRNLGLTLAEFLQTVLASIPDDLCITVDDL
jgi:predicted hydrolase (HD superfamily)